ncbi:MAG: GNAT family N-acetyltransferase [Dehalococcoidia bacterium]|nr:GNAT family N-acetyltransferase [Dehalococcoidia bacterium]
MFLEGERTRLRPPDLSEAPRFLEWIADTEVRHLIGGTAYPMTLAAEEEWLRSKSEISWDNGMFLAIDATDAPGGAPVHIGSIELRKLHAEARSGEVGMMIGERAYWGRGYGTDALRTLCRFAFEELDLHRLELGVAEYNPRAQRAYEKVGFVVEGRLRQDSYIAGRYYDTFVMGLLHSEFAE